MKWREILTLGNAIISIIYAIITDVAEQPYLLHFSRACFQWLTIFNKYTAIVIFCPQSIPKKLPATHLENKATHTKHSPNWRTGTIYFRQQVLKMRKFLKKLAPEWALSNIWDRVCVQDSDIKNHSFLLVYCGSSVILTRIFRGFRCSFQWTFKLNTSRVLAPSSVGITPFSIET